MRPTCVNRYSLLILMLLILRVSILAQHSSDAVEHSTEAVAGALGSTWNNGGGGKVTEILTRKIAHTTFEKTTASKSGKSNRRTPGGGPTPNRPNAPAPTSVASADGALRFEPTGTYLKTQELANLIADYPGSSPGEKEQIRALLESVLQAYEKQALKLGHPNDLAMALAFFLAENSIVYHGQPEPPEQQILDLRNTIAGALVEGGAFEGVTDHQKQEMYETLVSLAGLTDVWYQQAKQAGNEATAKLSQKLAGALLQGVTQVSPDNISFTASGLTINAESGVAPSPRATDSDKVLAQLTDLENEWNEANVKGDKGSINHILAEEFVGVGPDGTVAKKPQYVANLQPSTTVKSQTLSELGLSLKGTTAILTGINTVRFFDGRTERFRFTDTYSWRDGRWQAIMAQTSRID